MAQATLWSDRSWRYREFSLDQRLDVDRSPGLAAKSAIVRGLTPSRVAGRICWPRRELIATNATSHSPKTIGSRDWLFHWVTFGRYHITLIVDETGQKNRQLRAQANWGVNQAI